MDSSPFFILLVAVFLLNPTSISVAVFLTAFMPNYTAPPATLFYAYFLGSLLNSFMDSLIVYDSYNIVPVSALVGPKYLVANVFNGSPTEDQELAKTLVRPTGFYLNDLSKPMLLTKNKYGSVTRVFIISGEDKLFPVTFQKYIIVNSPPNEVKFINGSDHVVMTSKPAELYLTLQQIAYEYD